MFEPRTVLVGLAVGVGVTVVSAIGPARNAVRIPPVAALDDRQSGSGVSLRRRFVWGAALALVGVVMLAIGLAKPAIALVGVARSASSSVSPCFLRRSRARSRV